MNKLNVNVKLYGDYPRIKECLDEVKVFSNEIDNETLCIVVGNSKELKNIELNDNTICFTDKEVKHAHMKCSYIETQVLSTLDVLAYTLLPATIQIDIDEYKNKLINSKEFHIVSVSDATLNDATQLAIDSIENFKLYDVKNVILNLITNTNVSFLEITQAIELVKDKTSSDVEVVMGHTMVEKLEEIHVSMTLTK